MNPDFKKACDALCKEIADEKKVKQAFVSALVNAQMLIVKLAVLGTNVEDKKINVKETCNGMAQDLTALCFNFGEACDVPVEDVAECVTQVAIGMQPLINLYYGAAVKRIQIN